MRPQQDIEEAFDRYGDAVLRACIAAGLSRADAEDALQETFLKYATGRTPFLTESHRKAWLLRVAINGARDLQRRASNQDVPLEDADCPRPSRPEDEVSSGVCTRMDVAEALRALSDDQRVAVLLALGEGYTAPEVARIMRKPTNTVYSLITRGKRKLREVRGDE